MKKTIIVLALSIFSLVAFAQANPGAYGGNVFVVLTDQPNLQAIISLNFLYSQEKGLASDMNLDIVCDSKSAPKDFKVYLEDGHTMDIAVGEFQIKKGDKILYRTSFLPDTLHDILFAEDFTIRFRYFDGDELKSAVLDKEQLESGFQSLWNIVNMAK